MNQKEYVENCLQLHKLEELLFNKKFIELKEELKTLVAKKSGYPGFSYVEKELEKEYSSEIDHLLGVIILYLEYSAGEEIDKDVKPFPDFVERLSLMSLRSLVEVCKTFLEQETLGYRQVWFISSRLVWAVNILATKTTDVLEEQWTSSVKIHGLVGNKTVNERENILKDFDSKYPEIRPNLEPIVLGFPGSTSF